VIGGGPAGIIGATAASALGAKLALVDQSEDSGGAGANTGRAPSMTLRETALALSGIGPPPPSKVHRHIAHRSTFC